MILEDISSYIILAGAIIVAVTNIAKFFGRPLKFMKRKRDLEFKEKFDKSFKEESNILLQGLDEKITTLLEKDKQERMSEVCIKVDEKISATLNEIRDLNKEQSRRLELLSQSSKDLLRQKFMSIYHKGKKTKSLVIYDKEALEELYKDYKKEGGNSYIDKYYSRTLTWKIEADEDEEE